MEMIHVLILSLVEGITEFLPISSTGHMVLVSHALGIQGTDFAKSFEIIIQLGAILAVVAIYFKKLLAKKNYWPKIGIAFLPSAIIGFTLYPIIKTVLLNNPIITLIALFTGGIALLVVEMFYKEKEGGGDNLDRITYKQAFLIGCFQATSIVPGISRAAATIVGGMINGVKRTASVEFSFFLAIPTMFAATCLDLIKTQNQFTSQEYTMLVVGFITSFIVAIVAVRFFVNFIKHHTFIPFGIYRIILALIYFFIFIV